MIEVRATRYWTVPWLFGCYETIFVMLLVKVNSFDLKWVVQLCRYLLFVDKMWCLAKVTEGRTFQTDLSSRSCKLVGLPAQFLKSKISFNLWTFLITELFLNVYSRSWKRILLLISIEHHFMMFEFKNVMNVSNAFKQLFIVCCMFASLSNCDEFQRANVAKSTTSYTTNSYHSDIYSLRGIRDMFLDVFHSQTWSHSDELFAYFVSSYYQPWLCSILASLTIGCSGILPLFIIPMGNGKSTVTHGGKFQHFLNFLLWILCHLKNWKSSEVPRRQTFSNLSGSESIVFETYFFFHISKRKKNCWHSFPFIY